MKILFGSFLLIRTINKSSLVLTFLPLISGPPKKLKIAPFELFIAVSGHTAFLETTTTTTTLDFTAPEYIYILWEQSRSESRHHRKCVQLLTRAAAATAPLVAVRKTF